MDYLEAAARKIARWRRDAVAFVTEELGVTELDSWQEEALRVFVEPGQRRIAMKANKGPGKTAVEAWMIWHFLLTQADHGVHPKGKATGISDQNLKDNLWPELAKWQARSPILTAAFEWTQTRIQSRDHPQTWWFAKQPWPKSGDATQQANTLAGLHEDNVMFVLDESGGIPSAVMATAEGALANPGGFKKIVQAGNPTHLEGPLWDACSTHRDKWYVIEITGDPDDPKRSKRISEEWAREQIEMYGRDNPWVLINVFGQFPPSSLNTLLGPDEVHAAMRRHLKPQDFSWAQKRLGIDVARFGDDRTVLFARQGLNASEPPMVLRNLRTTEIAAKAMLAKRNWGTQVELIDDTGHWGHGVLDNLIAAGHTPHAVVFHAPANDPRYANRRAEMWLEMADWIKRGGALPLLPELVAELTTPTYTFNKKGQWIIEDKDLIKERLGRSPDLADALALTFAIPELPNNPDLPLSERQRGQGSGRVVTESEAFYDREAILA